MPKLWQTLFWRSLQLNLQSVSEQCDAEIKNFPHLYAALSALLWVITSLFLGEEAGESLFWRGVASGSCAAAGLFGRTRKFNTQVQHWYSAEQCLASASASQYWQTREGGREKAEKRTLPQRHLLALAGRTLVDKHQPAFISTELTSGGSRPGLW